MPKDNDNKVDQDDEEEEILRLEEEIRARKRPPYEIKNVVSTFNLKIPRLPIKELIVESGVGEYNAAKFAAMLLKLKFPRTSVLAFASASGVITGATSEPESRLGAVKSARIFRKLGYDVHMNNFTVQNIVCTGSAGFRLKLAELAADYSLEAQYEPELFPGLILRIRQPKCVALLFRRGKFIITGLKNIHDIDAVWENLYDNILCNYIDLKNSTTSSSEYRKMTDVRKDVLSKFIETINNMEMTAAATKNQIALLNQQYPVLNFLANVLNLKKVYNSCISTNDNSSHKRKKMHNPEGSVKKLKTCK